MAAKDPYVFKEEDAIAIGNFLGETVGIMKWMLAIQAGSFIMTLGAWGICITKIFS